MKEMWWQGPVADRWTAVSAPAWYELSEDYSRLQPEADQFRPTVY